MHFSLMFLIFTESTIMSLSSSMGEEMWPNRLENKLARVYEISLLIDLKCVRDRGFTDWKSTSAGREMSPSGEDAIIGNAVVAIIKRFLVIKFLEKLISGAAKTADIMWHSR